AVIASRVPDARFLIDCVLGDSGGLSLDAARIGIVGHSFGGWTALAIPDDEPRIRAVVALAPGGASRPRPGILPGKLASDGGGMFPLSSWLPRTTFAFPWTGCARSSQELRPANRW